MDYNATVELDRAAPDVGEVDVVLRRLEEYHAVVGASPAGRARVTLTLDARSLERATSEAIEVVESAFGAKARAAEVLPTVDFDALFLT